MSESFGSRVLESFSSSLNNQLLSDVTLVCDSDVYISAHKYILGLSSPVLMRYFCNNPNNSSIFMFGTSYNVLSSIMSFIYTGEATLNESDVREFLDVSNKLEIEGIKTENEMTTETDPIEMKSNSLKRAKISLIKSAKKKTKIPKPESEQKPTKKTSNEECINIPEGKLNEGDTDSKDNVVKDGVKLVSSKGNFKCETCEKTFFDKSTLRNHNAIKHLIEL